MLRGLSGALWRLVVRPVFVVEVRDGTARLRRGEAPAGLVAEFSDVASDFGIQGGSIYGVRARHGLTLDFSTDIPADAHQRFRNVLSVHRHRIKGA
jgi:hypothetical protein